MRVCSNLEFFLEIFEHELLQTYTKVSSTKKHGYTELLSSVKGLINIGAGKTNTSPANYI